MDVIFTFIGILCSVLACNIVSKMRMIIPWRVNCWFCNRNFWSKFSMRNCWYCPNCEQYNGFNKDGDYNKVLIKSFKLPKIACTRSENGLCDICNLRQRAKIDQLANFVPMNENKFDEEVELYSSKLDKLYRLCSSCRKVVQNKLHMEKKKFLGIKVIQNQHDVTKPKRTKNHHIFSILNYKTLNIVTSMVFILTMVESYKTIMTHKEISDRIECWTNIVFSLIMRTCDILLIKLNEYSNLFETFKENMNIFYLDVPEINWQIGTITIEKCQKTLWVIAILVQTAEHIFSLEKIGQRIFMNLLWVVYGVTFVSQTTVNPEVVTSLKLIVALAIYFGTRCLKNRISYRSVSPAHTMNMRNLTNNSAKRSMEEEELSDSDDESLYKYGVYNSTDSFNNNDLNNSIKKNKSFSVKNSSSPWYKMKSNSTFCSNSSKKIFSHPKSVYKPSPFGKYRTLSTDSDSDLDESISSLCISNPNRYRQPNKTIFSLKKFTASPNFVVPMPVDKSRPLISPSKLGYSTSWVAGGYWGTEGDHLNSMGSRSSSQSSGFESHASSVNQRNLFSQPPSREGSVCSDFNKTSTLFDRFQNCNINYPNSFVPLSSPVFPQMQYNNHVFIPQPQQGNKNSQLSQRAVEGTVFKIPGDTSLNNVSHMNGYRN